MKQINRCIIITAHHEALLKESLAFNESDFIICADGGADFALAEGIIPNMVIGDLDSASKIPISWKSGAAYVEDGTAQAGLDASDNVGFDDLDFSERPLVIKAPAEKDDTDTMLCLKTAMKLGYRNIVLLGGLGGRLDHTMANLQALAYFLENADDYSITEAEKSITADKQIWIIDGKNRGTMIENSELTFCKNEFLCDSYSDSMMLSLLAFSDRCTDVTITGVKYPLKNAVLINSFPIGVSNEFASEQVTVSVSSGKLLILFSTD